MLPVLGKLNCGSVFLYLCHCNGFAFEGRPIAHPTGVTLTDRSCVRGRDCTVHLRSLQSQQHFSLVFPLHLIRGGAGNQVAGCGLTLSGT